jgi:hypothetical protein
MPALPETVHGSSPHDRFLFCGFGAVFQNFRRLAFERFANGFERGEADGPGLAGLEDGQVLRRNADGISQIVQPHFPHRQDDVEINDDGHKLKR